MSARAVTAALVLALVLGTTPLWAGPVVRVEPSVVVHRDEILLGDVASIEGDPAWVERLRGLRLGPAPAPGTRLHLDADILRARLRSVAGAERVALVVPDRVAVTRASQTVASGEIVEAARGAARLRMEALDAGGAPHALVAVSRPGDVVAPTGRVSLAAHVQPAAPPYLFAAVNVAVQVDGREHQVVPVTFRVSRYRTVVVAVRALEPGRALGAGDLRLESRPESEVQASALGTVPDVPDLEPTRPVKAGDVVAEGMLRAKVLVKRGQVVTLIAAGRGFRITTQGQAGEDGRRGEVVRVINLGSRREVLGRVEGPGAVHVPLGETRSER